MADQVDAKLNVLSRGLRRRGEETAEERRQVQARDKNELKQFKKTGTAIVAALAPQSARSEMDEIDEENEAILREMAAMNNARPYLVNPLSFGNPQIEYDLVFGEEIDPQNLQPMMKIWRIVHFEPEEVDEATWAQFHTKDCYVIMWVADKEEQLVIHIHHWIGKEATADKWGAAAIRAVELNIFLGGMCRIHREEEGQESDEFKSYFADELEYLFGGSETAFRKVEEIKYEPKLYQVIRLGLGRNFYARRVQIHPKQLTKSDVFILDLGEYIMQWNGELVDVVHRQYSLQLVNEIHLIEHRGKSVRFMLEERNTEAELGYQERLFWKTLGEKVYLPPEELEVEFTLQRDDATEVQLHGSWAQEDPNWQQGIPLTRDRNTKRWKTKINLHFGHFTYRYEVITSAGSTVYTVDDERAVRVDKAGQRRNYVRVTTKEDPEPLLYHTIHKEGKLSLAQVDAPLSKNLLDDDHCFLLDCETEIFVWSSQRTPIAEKRLGRALARKFLDFERPEWCPIILQWKGAESMSFRAKFPDWRRNAIKRDYRRKTHSYGSVAPPQIMPPIDCKALLNSEQPVPESVDDGSGNTQVWVLTASGPTFEKLTNQEKGFFHSNNCYMVLYTYYDAEDRNRQKYVAYFWEGRECRHPKWWPSFLYGFFHPILQRKVGYGRIVPVRVLDGREPPHFMKLFRGMIVVRSGRRSRLRRRLKRQTALFSVSHLSGHTRAVQVPARVGSLHSRDSMLLLTATRLYVWHGRGASEDTRDEATLVAELLRDGRELKEIEEQLEPQPFWDVLEAGEDHIDSDSQLPAAAVTATDASKSASSSGSGSGERVYLQQKFQNQFSHAPVLYHCSCGSGVFDAVKLGGFCQTDLSPTEVFILDAHWDVFVWVGSMSSIATQSYAIKLAHQFADVASEERDEEVLVEQIHEGAESASFTSYFHAWIDEVSLARPDPYEISKQNIRKMRKKMYRMQQAAEKEKVQQEALAVLKAKQLGIYTELKRVDFSPELAKIGIVLKRQEEAAETSLNVPQGWTVFEWTVPEGEEVPLAVTLAGSWNNFEVEAMLKRKNKFVTALDLPVGRYTYYYKVATYEDVVICASQEEGRYPQKITVLDEEHEVNTLHIIAEDRPNGAEELATWRAKEEELFRKVMSRVEEVQSTSDTNKNADESEEDRRARLALERVQKREAEQRQREEAERVERAARIAARDRRRKLRDQGRGTESTAKDERRARRNREKEEVEEVVNIDPNAPLSVEHLEQESDAARAARRAARRAALGLK
mmetsp:Transcript_37227/g.93454  ORF Transcript_37227/g.93454 Transcript_37227/m.93454 type:complete len:1271 (+) Transcript_37227:422-4234(+)